MSTTCPYPNQEQRTALLSHLPRQASKPRQCEHIKANGEFCGSPALRGRHHCYFHLTHIGRRIRAERAHERAVMQSIDASATVLELPPFEDANSIQVALMQVTDAIVHNRIDPARARLVLRALQIARANLANGADFRQRQGATVAGRYQAFEEDFQLDANAGDLEIVEDEATMQDDEHAAELARIEELAQAYERVGAAREEAERRITARKDAGEDTEADEQELAAVENNPSEFTCHPVSRLLCKTIGPWAQAFREESATPTQQQRDASSQRLELCTRRGATSEKAA